MPTTGIRHVPESLDGVMILVVNCGSSSVKYKVFDGDDVVAHGLVERIGEPGGPADHDEALRTAASDMRLDAPELAAVGHRVVHGGAEFRAPVVVTDEVTAAIERLTPLAPLHNPPNLAGIAVARAIRPDLPQVAVFDTAFHQSLPETAYLYAIPYQLYRRYGVRRYGFHGTSHRYVAYRYRQLTGRSREETKIITLHLGNGCSACAIAGGHSLDTSMGFTPLEGLVMGTRSGDVDPAILEYIAVKEGMNLRELDAMLNKQSGLLGISGLTADMRELLAEAAENGDRRARLAIEIFCLRVKKYLGAYLAEMNGADAVVFTGGIGEHAVEIRRRICAGLDWLGIQLDDDRNAKATEGRFDKDGSRVQLWVIPTDEELLIARDAWRVVSGSELPS